MAWPARSRRRAELPADWDWRVRQVKKRARGRCEWKLPSGARCPARGTDADHRGDRFDHSLGNLVWSCEYHHDKKTSAQGRQALAARARLARRPTEQHPGQLRGQGR